VKVECLAALGNRLGESPLWCDRRRRLYWVDSRGPALHWLDGGTLGSLPLPELVGSIALLEEGTGLLAAMKTGFFILDPDRGTVTPFAALPDRVDHHRLNDGRVDRSGRFWAGTMNDAERLPTGALYRLDPDRSVHRILDDVIVPNSLAWSPDGTVMYFADTYRHRIDAFDFDTATGQPSSRRCFAEVAGPGRPDGSAVDADGCLWNAEYAGGRLVRYTPAGRIDRVIAVPVSNPTCCAFGGSRFDTLFVTSAAQRLSPEQLAREPLAGGLIAVQPGVSGLPESRFRGGLP